MEGSKLVSFCATSSARPERHCSAAYGLVYQINSIKKKTIEWGFGTSVARFSIGFLGGCCQSRNERGNIMFLGELGMCTRYAAWVEYETSTD